MRRLIKELRKIADNIAKARQAGNGLGLSAEELAFYAAITKPEAVKDFYSHNQLRELTKELAETLRKNRTVNWQKRIAPALECG